jgi:hypothetical protein
MDVVGGVAAVAQLTIEATKIVRKAWKLYRSSDGAPAELQQLAEHLQSASTVLQVLEGTVTSPAGYIGSRPIFDQLAIELKSANILVTDLADDHRKYVGTKQLRKCLEFGLKGKKRIDEQACRLSTIQQRLNTLMITELL